MSRSDIFGDEVDIPYNSEDDDEYECRMRLGEDRWLEDMEENDDDDEEDDDDEVS